MTNRLLWGKQKEQWIRKDGKRKTKRKKSHTISSQQINQITSQRGSEMALPDDSVIFSSFILKMLKQTENIFGDFFLTN